MLEISVECGAGVMRRRIAGADVLGEVCLASSTDVNAGQPSCNGRSLLREAAMIVDAGVEDIEFAKVLESAVEMLSDVVGEISVRVLHHR
ncbi:isoflavone 2'-hydroxylase-like [Dorcoceras hygrometricum]|uniref:Isoflavone 2'-hydroxylase-like n=1 Tax=Dorcoceras hygrometricum TaxID=472368 RepID=A0A2Z7AU86_9LAMI|nr:isoflavone 2'-hydroxylase-like [Dorcoceras hygrometricum]